MAGNAAIDFAKADIEFSTFLKSRKAAPSPTETLDLCRKRNAAKRPLFPVLTLFGLLQNSANFRVADFAVHEIPADLLVSDST